MGKKRALAFVEAVCRYFKNSQFSKNSIQHYLEKKHNFYINTNDEKMINRARY